MTYVSDHAHDLERSAEEHCDPAADWILVRPEPASHGLIDHDGRGGRIPLPLVEHPAAYDGNPHGSKVLLGDASEECVRRIVRIGRWAALDRESARLPGPAQGQGAHDADRRYPRLAR